MVKTLRHIFSNRRIEIRIKFIVGTVRIWTSRYMTRHVNCDVNWSICWLYCSSRRVFVKIGFPYWGIKKSFILLTPWGFSISVKYLWIFLAWWIIVVWCASLTDFLLLPWIENLFQYQKQWWNLWWHQKMNKIRRR